MVERKFPRSTTNQKHYQDQGSARHRYGISVLVTQTSFCESSSGDLAKSGLFSQAISSPGEEQCDKLGQKEACVLLSISQVNPYIFFLQRNNLR